MNNQTALYALQFFMNRGYSPIAAAGMVGNLDHESGLNPNISGDPRAGRNMATGIAQWWPDRWANLTNWAGKQGLNPRSLDTQLGFVDYELRSRPKVYQQVVGAQTVRDAAAAFGLGYESPQGAQTGVAENMHGWGSRLGRAMNFASLATGKPMSEFAKSGWTPPAGGAAAPGTAAQGSGDFTLGPPPEFPSTFETDTSPRVASSGGSHGYDETDLRDLEYPSAGLTNDYASLNDATAGTENIANKWRLGKADRAQMSSPIADLFQTENINLQKIGTANRMAPTRKFG